MIAAVSTAFFFLHRNRDRAVRELVPTRVISNGSDAPVMFMALSPDGTRLYAGADEIEAVARQVDWPAE